MGCSVFSESPTAPSYKAALDGLPGAPAPKSPSNEPYTHPQNIVLGPYVTLEPTEKKRGG